MMDNIRKRYTPESPICQCISTAVHLTQDVGRQINLPPKVYSTGSFDARFTAFRWNLFGNSLNVPSTYIDRFGMIWQIFTNANGHWTLDHKIIPFQLLGHIKGWSSKPTTNSIFNPQFHSETTDEKKLGRYTGRHMYEQKMNWNKYIESCMKGDGDETIYNGSHEEVFGGSLGHLALQFSFWRQFDYSFPPRKQWRRFKNLAGRFKTIWTDFVGGIESSLGVISLLSSGKYQIPCLKAPCPVLFWK